MVVIRTLGICRINLFHHKSQRCFVNQPPAKPPRDADYGPHESWCDTQNQISERCNCMAGTYIDKIERLEQELADVKADKDEIVECWEKMKQLYEDVRKELDELQNQLSSDSDIWTKEIRRAHSELAKVIIERDQLRAEVDLLTASQPRLAAALKDRDQALAQAAAAQRNADALEGVAQRLAEALEREQTLREQGAFYSPDEWQNSYEVNKERTTNALTTYREFLKECGR